MTQLPEAVMLAVTANSDTSTSIVTPAIVAAVIAGVISLGTFAWAGRRTRLDRQRQVFATAMEAITAYREYPYIVRRRDPDPAKAAEERVRISNDLSKVQASIALHGARLKIEDAYVGERYELLVLATKRVAGALIHKAWDEPGVGADPDVHAPHIDMSELDKYDKAYLQAVRDHLGPWWAPLRRKVRRDRNRATLPEDARRAEQVT